MCVRCFRKNPSIALHELVGGEAENYASRYGELPAVCRACQIELEQALGFLTHYRCRVLPPLPPQELTGAPQSNENGATSI